MPRRSLKAYFFWLRLRLGRVTPTLQRARELVRHSDLFDAEWYIRRYPDVARAALNPLDHFITHGGAEGRSPGPRFDAKWYLQRNPDVARTASNPLLHYLDHGRHEGRSIRAVQPGSDDGEEAAFGDKADGAKQPTVQPYVDEYDASWLAAPIEWTPLWAQLAQSPILPHDGTLDWTDLASLCSSPEQETDRKRIDLFAATAPGATITGAADWREIDRTGLGIEAIADGWFAHSRLLMLRVTEENADAAAVVGFQYAADEQPICVGTQLLAGVATLIRLDLRNPLTPVLLIWLTAERTIHGSALIAFPSFYRGGLHHSELLAAEELDRQPHVAARYMTELARAFYVQGDLLLGNITVQLRGTNGSEPIFQPFITDALSRHFGVALRADDNATGSELIANRLVTVPIAPVLAARRNGGTELLLPGDCLPSLAVLCLERDSDRLGSETFCIMPDFGREPPVLAFLPRPTGPMIRFQHPSLPVAQPTWKPGLNGLLPGKEYGLPTAIRTMNPKVWAVDTLMPLPPDVPDPGRGDAPARLPTLGVILYDTGSQSDLDICLRAIAGQLGVAVTHVFVLSERADLALPEYGVPIIPIRIAASDPTGMASGMAGDGNSVVLVVDSAVFPHDPRTFAILAALCVADDVGAATCPVVTSSAEEGAAESAVLPGLRSGNASTDTGNGEQFVSLFPAYSFAHAVVNPQIFAIRSEHGRAFLASAQLPESSADFALVVANHCFESGQRIVATTVVRVASRSPHPSFADTDTKPASEERLGDTNMRDAQIIRLRP